MVFAGVYPFDAGEHAKLKSAIDKVCLNDFSVSLTTESSMAMGLGWRVGFLGLLHMEVRTIFSSPTISDSFFRSYQRPFIKLVLYQTI